MRYPLFRLFPLFPLFTGIIESTASVLEKSSTGLIVERPASFDDISIGSSIAVAGVCLSVSAFGDTSMIFDVVEETWEKTNLGNLRQGSLVNLERALAANGRFDGHIVQGHVEGTASVSQEALPSAGARLAIQVSDELIKNCVQKGSITIDGVSLTIASIDGNIVKVALVPYTLEHTTLGKLKKGDHVNVETDIIGKYLQKYLKPGSGLTACGCS